MAIHPQWSDEYWLLLMQLYLKKPVGIKPLYSRGLVALSLELHIPPQVLYGQMFRLRRMDSPSIRQLWERYGDNPRKLSGEVGRLRGMYGFGMASTFYGGVEVKESFERDFKPVFKSEKVNAGNMAGIADDLNTLTPAMLVMILDLYFRLTPITMVEETPDIKELGRILKIHPSTVVEVMDVFKFCDPYLNSADVMISPLLVPCQKVWNRFGNDNPERLSSFAAQLREYFR